MNDRLTERFRPTRLIIRDDSERHRGHAGYQDGGESHWHVDIAAASFEGVSRIDRHRQIHEALGRDIIGRIHALSLRISAS